MASRQKGTIIESGSAAVDRKRCACINKILSFDGTIDYQAGFDFFFEVGVGSRPKRLVNHLISLDCLRDLDRIHQVLFPDSRPTRSIQVSTARYIHHVPRNLSRSCSTIEKDGFVPSEGGMLGEGVYVSRDIEKAKKYGPVVLEVAVKVGRVKRIDRQGHPLQKSWSQNGYDTAWVPPGCGMVRSGREEDCVLDPERLMILRRVPG